MKRETWNKYSDTFDWWSQHLFYKHLREGNEKATTTTTTTTAITTTTNSFCYISVGILPLETQSPQPPWHSCTDSSPDNKKATIQMWINEMSSGLIWSQTITEEQTNNHFVVIRDDVSFLSRSLMNSHCYSVNTEHSRTLLFYSWMWNDSLWTLCVKTWRVIIQHIQIGHVYFLWVCSLVPEAERTSNKYAQKYNCLVE